MVFASEPVGWRSRATELLCYPLLFLVVLMPPVWWGLHDTLVPLDSTYGSPGPPKNEILHRLLTYFTCCWEDSFGVKSILKCS